jgi:hypothetical protein
LGKSLQNFRVFLEKFSACPKKPFIRAFCMDAGSRAGARFFMKKGKSKGHPLTVAKHTQRQTEPLYEQMPFSVFCLPPPWEPRMFGTIIIP